jgi:hypothetical protein
MINLPPTSSSSLKCFCLACSLIAGFTIEIVAFSIDSKVGMGLGVTVGAGLAAAGRLWPAIVSKPYRIWDRLARRYAGMLRQVILLVSYWLIFPIVGQAASSSGLKISSSNQSLWVSRAALSTKSYFWQHDSNRNPLGKDRGWICTFISWSIQSRNIWSCSLLPFLILLSFLEEAEQQDHVPSNIYTLY